jgi:hypothetical protein
VASRLESEAFWAALYRLRDELAVPAEKMQTLLCNEVASRLEDETFWMAIYRLCDELAVSVKTLPKGLVTKTASRLDEGTFWTALRYLLSMNMEPTTLGKFGISFWKTTDDNTAKDTIELLVGEYGFAPSDVPKDNTFWSNMTKPGGIEALRAHLAECRTTGAVDAHVRRLNRGRLAGRGATRCKFARPRLEHEPVARLGATKQLSLAAMFGRPA